LHYISNKYFLTSASNCQRFLANSDISHLQDKYHVALTVLVTNIKAHISIGLTTLAKGDSVGPPLRRTKY